MNMANVQGYPGHNGNLTLKRLAVLLAFVCLIAGALLVSSKDRRRELPVILPAAALAGIFMVISSMKMTTLSWKKVFRKSEYEQMLSADLRIAAVLAGLDDTHFIFHDVHMEFFHCDHLVIGPSGVFVIRRAILGAEAEHADGCLVQVGESLAKRSRSLWQICHFLSIIIKKGYKTETFPQPVFVCPEGPSGAVGKVANVPLVSLADLPAWLTASGALDFPKELPRRLSAFIHERYARGIDA